MLDDAKRAAAEQAQAALVELIPAICWQLYCEFGHQGFDDSKAFELTKMYLANAIRPV